MPILNQKIGSTITNLDPKHEGPTRGHEGSIKQTNSTFIIQIDNKLNKFLITRQHCAQNPKPGLKKSKPQLEGMVANYAKVN